MPRERLPMRKIRDVLRLHAGKLSKRRIAVSLSLGRTAVGDHIKRATRAGLGWPLPEKLSDEALERLLFPPPVAISRGRRPPPDWPVLHRELKRSGVTLSLLWEEYRAVHLQGPVPNLLQVASALTDAPRVATKTWAWWISPVRGSTTSAVEPA